MLTAALVPSLLAFAAAVAGGATFDRIGVPLPWTLGPIFVCGAIAIAGSRALMHSSVMLVARPAVGVMVGSAFTPAIAASLVQWWPEILFVLAFSMTISASGYLLFRHVFGLDRVTAFVAGLPAGLAELTVIGGALGGNLRVMVMIHAIRIVSVVFIVPLFLTFGLGLEIVTTRAGEGPVASSLADWAILIGCGLGGALFSRYMKLPGGVMIAALALSALVHATGLSTVALPFWAVALAQVFIGSVLGARFSKIAFRELRDAFVAAVVWVVVLMGLTIGAAAIATGVFGRPLPVALLALAPGGMAEMALVTYALGIDVAFVVTCQVARMFFLLTTGPFVAARIARVGQPPG
jgi:membrane AbrB-like protein